MNDKEKHFPEWNERKIVLDANSHKAPYVSTGDIWWVSMGANIGSEIDGKSELFSRPAIVYKKLAHGFHFVIPTTSQQKEGSWYVGFRHKGKDMYVCLHQARAIDYRRFSSKLGSLDDQDLERIGFGFRKLYY